MANIQGKVKNKRFQTNAKLLLGDDLQKSKLNEETAQQILSLLQSPISTVTQNLTQPLATNTQPGPVMRVSASLVTTKSSDQGIPLSPPPRGLTPPTKKEFYQQNLLNT